MDLLYLIKALPDVPWADSIPFSKLSPPESKHALELLASSPPPPDPYYCSKESQRGLDLGQRKLPAAVWVNHNSAVIDRPTPRGVP